MKFVKSFRKLSLLKKFVFLALIVLLLLTAFNIFNFMQLKASINENLSNKQLQTKLESNKPKAVQALIIESSECIKCFDLSLLIKSMQKAGIIFSDVKKLDYATAEAKMVVKKFGIEKIPVLLLSESIASYSITSNFIKNYAVKEGFYVIESPAPYIEVSTGKLRGLLSFTGITDEKCSECIDVNKLKTAFEGIGLIFGSTEYFDLSSSEGSELVNKFHITKVPTVILAGDTSAYPGLENFWLQFGTIEDNNIYVFRSLELIQDVVYFDLNQNKIVGISDTNN